MTALRTRQRGSLMTHYIYRKDPDYEYTYEVYSRGFARQSIGVVQANLHDDFTGRVIEWFAELHDGHRGSGRTRDEAVFAARDAARSDGQ